MDKNTAESPTETARHLFERVPFHRANEIALVEVTDKRARTRLPFDESLVGNPDVPAIHGGAISALVDLTGAAIFMGDVGDYTPTVDLRIDYLSPARPGDLVGEAKLRRRGDDIGVARIRVTAGDELCATGIGVYKLSQA